MATREPEHQLMAEHNLTRCIVCWRELVKVLVSKTGRPPRRKVMQCSRHCDMKCPKCNNTLRVTREDQISKKIRCYRCHWTGLGLSAIELEKWHKTSAARKSLTEARKEWKLFVPDVGSPCHDCGHPLTEKISPASQTSAEFYTWTRSLVCKNLRCRAKPIRSEQKRATTAEEWLSFRRREAPTRFPLQTWCFSCNQVPSTDGHCGCS